ncbi:MAG: hypothetical protein HYS04_15655 [Acidobacteria bacterium]|nr:hypothetical protein [Acidobacteriota bacterium]
MRQLLVIVAIVLPLCAQTEIFEKAPPAIDEALRARVAKFFQAHVDGKFRTADEVVAEDSKDAFFTMDKKRYLAFDIVTIVYSENFTKAKVVTAVEMEWRSPRVGVMRVKPPLTSLWKLETGQWWWYVVPQKDWETPWGKMTPGPDPPGGSAILQAFKGADPATILRQVVASKQDVSLSSYQPSTDEVTVKNGMPGEITLELRYGPRPGLEISVDRKTLNHGEQARVSFRYTPPDTRPKDTLGVIVHVEPINLDIPLKLTFAVPDQLLQKVPAGVSRSPK